MKEMKRLAVFMFLFVAILVGCNDTSSNSQSSEGELNYPNDNLMFTVPYPAGGVNDVISRKIASYGNEYFNTPAVVENLPGGGGSIGATEYLKETANAHNILLASRSMYVTIPLVQEIQYSFDDIEPIIGIDNVEFILYTSPEQSGIDSLESLIEYGETNTIHYGTAGPGTDIDLIQGGLFAMAGVKVEPVVYGGGAEAITNVAAGHIHVAAGPPGAGKELVKDGSVVPIAVASSTPYEGFEGITVPTLPELGYEIDYSGLNFYAIREGTDEEVIQFLYDQISAIYETEDFQELVVNMDIDLKPIGPDEISQYIEEQSLVAEELNNLIQSHKN